MKKPLIFLLSCFLLLGFASALADSDYEFNSEDYAITGYTGPGGDVVIPDSIDGCPVDIIESSVFYNNATITSVVLPEGLSVIKPSAFNWCDNLASITLPSTLVALDDSAIYDCGSLTEITIPASVSYIGMNVLSNCDLLSAVYFEGKAPVIERNVLKYIADGAVIYVPDDEIDAYRAALPEGLNIQPSGKNAVVVDFTAPEADFDFDAATGAITLYKGLAARVDIPSSIGGVPVTAIGDEAFFMHRYCYYVTIPEGVTWIGDRAFITHCLSAAILPETLKEIGDGSFKGYRGGSIGLPVGLERIGDNAFEWSYLYDTLVIQKGLKEIGNGAFIGNRSLYLLEFESLDLPQIGADAFLDCTLEDIDLPWYATRAQALAVQGIFDAMGQTAKVWRMDRPDRELISDYFYDSDTQLLAESNSTQAFVSPHYSFYHDNGDIVSVIGIGEGVFKGSATIDSFFVPHSDEFTIIGAEAFAGSTLREIDLFDSITRIENGAFRNCLNLTEIVFPESVQFIGEDAFEGCANLTSVVFAGGDCTIGDRAFANTGLTAFVIPAGAQLGADALIGVPLDHIRASDAAADADVLAYSSALGYPWFSPILRQSEQTSPLAPAFIAMPDEPSQEGDFQFDAETGTILKYTGNAERVVIPRAIGGAAVLRIGYDAFPDAKDASDAYLAGNAQVTHHLKSVVIPETVIEIDNYAFQYCRELTMVDCYGPLDRVGNGAFVECTGLTRVSFHNSLKDIDNYAFQRCISLTSIDFGSSLDSIGEQAFQEAGFVELTLNVKSIARNAFWQCPELAALHIGARLEKIDNGAFSECAKLTEVCLPADAARAFVNYAQFGGIAPGAVFYVPTDTTEEQVNALFEKLSGGYTNPLTDIEQIVLRDCDAVAAEASGQAEDTTPTDPEPTQPEPTDPEPIDPEPTDPEPTDPDDSGTTVSAEFTDLLYVCTSADVDGVDLDVSMLGYYAVIFHSDGTVEMTIGGVEMPPCPWVDTEEGIAVDYYGQPFLFERTETGFVLNYYDTMLLFYEPE